MSKITRAHSKFSNEYIFRRKEKELKNKKGSKSFRIFHKTSDSFFLKPNKEENNYFIFSLLSTSTTSLLKDITDFNSLRKDIWDKAFNENEEKEKEKGKNNLSYITNRKYNLNKTSTRFYNNMFLTEINKVNKSKSFSSYNKINNSFVNINSNRKLKKELNNEKIKKEKFINNPLSKSFLFSAHNNNISNKNDNNIDLLKYFQEQKRLFHGKENFTVEITKDMNKSFASFSSFNSMNIKRKNNYFTHLIDLKTKNICVKKDNSREFIDKIKEFKILDYENKISKEKNKKIIENYKNNIDYYNDYTKNVRKTTNILNKKFLSKLNDYMRFIYYKIEEEKKKEINLISAILLLKRDIKQLNIIIKRKDLEKNEILKWIYFQIQVKEKKLSLPSYYKEIIENKSLKNPKKDERNRKLLRMTIKPSVKGIKKYNFDSFSQRKSFKIKRLLNQSQKDLNIYDKSVEKSINASDEEIKKIKNYLKYPIYKDVEELIDSLEFFKNEIILKSRDYYELRNQVYSDRNNLLKYQEELSSSQINYEKILKTKNEELEIIKEMNNNQKKEKMGIKQNQKTDKLLMIMFQEPNKKIGYNNYPLLNKINELYEMCNVFQLKLDKRRMRKMNDSHPSTAEMIFKLKYITQVLDNIYNKFKYYKENDINKSELMKKTKSEIDKNHKNAKNMEQKIKEREKSIKLLNKIEERNNKIFFLSYRKVDNHSIIGKKNKIKSSNISKVSFMNFYN